MVQSGASDNLGQLLKGTEGFSAGTTTFDELIEIIELANDWGIGDIIELYSEIAPTLGQDDAVRDAAQQMMKTSGGPVDIVSEGYVDPFNLGPGNFVFIATTDGDSVSLYGDISAADFARGINWQNSNLGWLTLSAKDPGALPGDSIPTASAFRHEDVGVMLISGYAYHHQSLVCTSVDRVEFLLDRSHLPKEDFLLALRVFAEAVIDNPSCEGFVGNTNGTWTVTSLDIQHRRLVNAPAEQIYMIVNPQIDWDNLYAAIRGEIALEVPQLPPAAEH